MGLEFCPVCKRILQIKEVNGKHIGVCSCGFKRMSGINVSSSEKPESDKMKKGEGAVKDSGEKIDKMSYEEKREKKADY